MPLNAMKCEWATCMKLASQKRQGFSKQLKVKNIIYKHDKRQYCKLGEDTHL